ncbi:hypothetical protein C8F04DRAFT_1036017 [Mycena alexandri]|uniref:MYND-type domain-containing protein n=1 Tax=Mycena alexandri TaxID=1745969 RepID=A0AAD6X564_9AGAR|nr:hypothetical protein C8F04DRAFT_1036017 [Mycena alexandri]
MPLARLTRQEILDLLALVGVEISPRTKINDEKLNKRLSQVLDSCQYLSRVLPEPPLSPTSFPLWKEAAKGVALGEAITRTNPDEASFLERCRAQGNMDPIPMHANAFRDLRHSLQSIAALLDLNQGYSRYTFQDPQETSDIRLKVLEVRTFDSSTSIFIVQYHHRICKGPLQPWADATLPTTLKEQHLILRLLKRNRKRIDSGYRPSGVELEISVSYCSKGCQTDHWKTHRPMCNSVASGTWKEITVRHPSSWNLNRYEVVGHPEIYARSFEHFKSTAPDNIHGTLPFIVKVQLAAADASNLPAVIGQKVGLDKLSANPVEFETVAGLVREKGFRGLRLFCWATRSGDWTLRLCLDHLPEEQKW